MRKSKFTEEQIIAILAEQERGMATEEVCRRHGVSSATFYKWKSKYGGMDVSITYRIFRTFDFAGGSFQSERTGDGRQRRQADGERDPHR